uniref:MAM domain-containing protein n=1 Tax=Mesocestoides corti TaxID=53468 RepID=A0A5K3F0Q6_MESCO
MHNAVPIFFKNGADEDGWIELPSPFHVWDFENGFDGWVNDLNNWDQKWITEKSDGGSSVCLFPKASTHVKSEDVDPWAIGEENDEQLISVDVKARLWSRKIPSKLSMQCITLFYTMSLGGAQITDLRSEAVTLALLQRSEGCCFQVFVDIVPSGHKFFFKIALNPPTPFHVWTFDRGFSGWTNDGNNWDQKWHVDTSIPSQGGIVCLLRKSMAVTDQDELAPWIGEEGPAVEADVQARLWSPRIPTSVRPSSAPFHVWSFHEDLADWNNDYNNWRRKWDVISIDGTSQHRSVCLLAKAPLQLESTKSKTPWLVTNSFDDPLYIKARLWSPQIPVKLGMKCLTVFYTIVSGGGDESSFDANLTLLQRQEGCL